jgi:type III secretion protein J
MRRVLVMLLALVALTACGRAELYSDLSERDANEMIAVLRAAGVDASKRSAGNARWSLHVADSQFVDAVSTLGEQGLPRAEFAEMGELFRRQGFVSTPLEERARYVFGLEQELSRTLSSVDGVLLARVHLAVPERAPMSDQARPSSASVFIKHRAGLDMSEEVTRIRGLVVNSVEGLVYDNVSVALFPAEPRALPVAQTSGATGFAAFGLPGSLLATVFVLGGLLLLLSTVGGRFWRRAAVPADPAADRQEDDERVSILPSGNEAGGER